MDSAPSAPGAADAGAPPAKRLSDEVAAFCALLRHQHGFALGPEHTLDALRALAAVGIADLERVRCALRLVCCSTHAQLVPFAQAFDAFFLSAPRGAAQPAHASRSSAPADNGAPSAEAAVPADDAPAGTQRDAPDCDRAMSVQPSASDARDGASAWHALRARYSAAAGSRDAPAFDPASAVRMRAAARAVVRALRAGRARRWTGEAAHGRFDLRRTVRDALRTGGDITVLHYLRRPRYHPRFVILIDGSRSMASYNADAVAFAAALIEQTARAAAFVFSTALRDVTHDLRDAMRNGNTVTPLSAAWGGGTQIGANLRRFVRERGDGLLARDTLVLIYSDGLDAGDAAHIADAMAEIERRSAGIVWMNPHAETEGYAPTARGMRAALPFIRLLCAGNADGFERLAARMHRVAL